MTIGGSGNGKVGMKTGRAGQAPDDREKIIRGSLSDTRAREMIRREVGAAPWAESPDQGS